MSAIVLVLLGAVGFGAFLGWRDARRRGRLQRLVASAVDAATREAAIAALRGELAQIGERFERTAAWRGRRAPAVEMQEARLALAVVLARAGRFVEVLDELVQIDLSLLPRAEQIDAAYHAAIAHLRLGQLEEAGRLLDRISLAEVAGDGRALWTDARAQWMLSRGDARQSLRLLAEAQAQAPQARAALALTRARALAARGESSDEVWQILAAQPRDALAQLVQHHPDEPAAAVARRVLSGEGPYR